MAKARMIRPEIWTDERFVSLDPLARLLFIGMWNHACDNGHLDDSPIQLKMRVLPADNCDVDALIEQVTKTGMVERREGFLKVVNLARRQKVDTRYLLLCDHCTHDGQALYTEADRTGPTSGTRRAHGGDTSGTQRAHDGKRSKEKRSEEKGSAHTRATQLPPDWSPTDEHKVRAKEHGLDLSWQATKFRLHAEENGRTAKNWNAAFTRWLMNAKDFERPAPAFQQRLDAEKQRADKAWGAA